MLFFNISDPYLQNRKVKREIYVHNCFLRVFVGHSQEKGAWVWKEVGGGGCGWPVDQWVELKIRSF